VGGAAERDRKVNVLVFGGGDSEPALVLKLARSPGYREHLEREFAALSELSGLPDLTGSLPEPLGSFETDDHLVVAEGIVRGTPLSVLLRRRQRISPREVRRDLGTAAEWIGRLQQAVDSRSVTFGGEAEMLKRLETSSQALPASFVERTLEAAGAGDGMTLNLTAAHGDFWPANLMLVEDHVGVIDWEDYAGEGWPFTDFFSFLTQYAFTFPWTGWRRPDRSTAFRRAFVDEGWFATLVAEAVLGFFQRLGLPAEAIHLCYSLFLLEQAAPRPRDGDRRRHLKWRELASLYDSHAERTVFHEMARSRR
jgi:hypothetical protein